MTRISHEEIKVVNLLREIVRKHSLLLQPLSTDDWDAGLPSATKTLVLYY